MQSSDLVSSFGEIARSKDIDRDTLQLVIEDAFRTVIHKRYGSDEAFEIIFNPSQGDIQIIHIQEVVADWDLEDPVTQIELSGARRVDEDFEVGDEVAGEVNIAEFGRRAVMLAGQTFRQKIRDIEKEHIYNEYSKIVGEIVVGEVYQERRREVLVMHEGVELVMPRREQIPRERHRKGNTIRSVVKEVLRDAGSSPQVIISRSDTIFMERLFELEVPEIYEGIVEIKKVARIPGDRAKVAVMSHDERVDPIGACVGVKGVRIHGVVRELNNENIDVLLWSDDPHQLIKNALSPASPTGVRFNERAIPPRARVEVPADEVSQAIGRGGVNIRLASMLTEYELDVYRNIPAGEEDIDIEEFGDELSEETIGQLKMIGCDTGKAVLELSVSELARRAELDKETAGRVLEIIRTEFERGPAPEPLFKQPFTLERFDPTRPADVDTDEPPELLDDEMPPLEEDRAAEAARAEDEFEGDLGESNLPENDPTERELVDEDPMAEEPLAEQDARGEAEPEEDAFAEEDDLMDEELAERDLTEGASAAAPPEGMALDGSPDAPVADDVPLAEKMIEGGEAAPAAENAALHTSATPDGDAPEETAPAAGPEETNAAGDEYTSEVTSEEKE